MKIKLLSDLHLESRQGYAKHTPEWAKPNDADVLVLAGDIAVGPTQVSEALKYFKSLGHKEIIYVPGNHEYYHHSFSTHQALRGACEANDVHMLDPRAAPVKIKDVTFFGGTLWTDFHNDPLTEIDAKQFINDFKVIKDFSTALCSKLNREAKDYIKYFYEETPGKKCIVTHFLPAMQCISPRFAASALNKYFANNLDDWIESLENTTWLFGHTHDRMDFHIGNTRMVVNPLGYSGEFSPTTFNPNKIIEL